MSNTVLSWKKQQKLGRFDPDAVPPEEMLKEQVEKEKAEIEKRGKNMHIHSCLTSNPDNRFPRGPW